MGGHVGRPNPLLARVTALFVSAFVVSGCDTGPTRYEPLDLPAVNVTSIEAATGLTADGGLDFEPLHLTSGGVTASGVLSTTSFRVQFDRLLEPDTATRQAICVQPLLGNVASASTCDAGILLYPSYDPVRRQITFRQDPTSARPGAGTRYELTLYTAVLATDNGVRSFDGIPLQAPVQVELTILPDPGGVVPPYDPVPTADHFCTPDTGCGAASCARPVAQILGGCALTGCHLQTAASGAAEDLRLDTPALIAATAINQVAHETETGESALNPDPNGPRFGRAMPIIAPDTPGNSYLLYKLLAHPGVPLQYPFLPYPASGVAPEIVRVQDELIEGMPMPPSTQPDAVPRGTTGVRGEMEWLSDWILEGAPVATCN